ncbi:MAG: tyrosine-type recombinase/integrase [Candidatus Ranarchaeia archaeon]
MSRIAAYKALKRRIKHSGLNKEIHPHTFRHSFITWKLNKKMPLFAVQKFVGHKLAQTTAQYYHFTQDDLRDVLEV